MTEEEQIDPIAEALAEAEKQAGYAYEFCPGSSTETIECGPEAPGGRPRFQGLHLC
jgi:hypothetical protein